MKTRQELLADPALHNPAELTLACGHRIPNVGGIRAWNHYDLRWVTTTVATTPDVDTSGRLPHGATYWAIGDVDCSRATCEACGG
jgi:hypothetical protein